MAMAAPRRRADERRNGQPGARAAGRDGGAGAHPRRDRRRRVVREAGTADGVAHAVRAGGAGGRFPGIPHAAGVRLPLGARRALGAVQLVDRRRLTAEPDSPAMSHESPTPRLQPSASYSFTMRLHLSQQGGAFASVARAIVDTEALLGAIDLVRVEGDEVVRDVTVACVDSEHAEAVVRAVRALEGVRVDSVSDRTFLMHKGGKIEVTAKLPVKTRDDLSMAYTPGVGRVSMAIYEDPAKAWALTIKSNTVAVVSDGTAVLGLGDIGPEAAMPVMEGKALLFKEFAGVDAFPLCLATKDVDEIVAIVKGVAPGFGGVNLEDISAPRCFEIERRLRAELDIPVFHDDQHGTAIVVLAALLNALRLVGKRLEDVNVVVVGAGAASIASAEVILAHAVGALLIAAIARSLY